jgi:small-conductance mechanosensitive channel
MFELLSSFWANDLYRKVILTVLILFGQNVFYRLVTLLILQRIDEDNSYIYTVRKAANYTINAFGALLILTIWINRTGDLSVALGILGAGLAFALQEVIGSFAGWLTIISGRPFAVGDRIETSSIRGDVVDVGILRTTLMEIGNWLQGDHNTGRIVTVSNAFIFKEPLYNYSAHLDFIWDEISIPITYESDWQKAMVFMSESVQTHPQYQQLLPKAEAQRRQVRRELAVKITSLDPRVFVKITDNWIELSMVYPVDNDLRRAFRSEVSQRILLEFAKANIIVASQTMSIVHFPNETLPKITLHS